METSQTVSDFSPQFSLPLLHSAFPLSYFCSISICRILSLITLPKVILAFCCPSPFLIIPLFFFLRKINFYSSPSSTFPLWFPQPSCQSFMVCLHLQSVMLHFSLWLPSNGMSLTLKGIPKFPNTLIQKGHP